MPLVRKTRFRIRNSKAVVYLHIPIEYRADIEEWKEDSRPLNKYLWSDSPKVDKFIRDLYPLIAYWDPKKALFKPLPTTNKGLKNTLSVLRVVTLNCLVAELSHDKNRSIGVRLDGNAWVTKDNRYLPDFYSRTHVSRILEGLMRGEYIDFHRRKKGLPGRSSRFGPKSKLIDMMLDYGISLDDITVSEYMETIRVSIKNDKDEKELVDYEDTPQTTQWRKDLAKYRDLLYEQDIKWSPPDVDSGIPKISTYNAYRVFNSTDFNLGGRFYGCFWTYKPKDTRRYITINGNKTIELDYRSCQPKLLYARNGVYYSDDAYQISGYDQDEQGRDRALLKSMFMCMLNNSSRAGAITAFYRDVREDKELEEFRKSNNFSGADIIASLEDKHSPIIDYFYKEEGLVLQYEDSILCSSIINKFTDQGIPVLTVHDSFIVEEQYEELLQEIMINEFSEYTGLEVTDKQTLIKKEY